MTSTTNTQKCLVLPVAPQGSYSWGRKTKNPKCKRSFSYPWWAELKLWWPKVSSQQRGRLLAAAADSAPHSSPVGAGRQPKLPLAAGSRPPAAAASAPGGTPGPPCPCYCWLTPCHLDRKPVRRQNLSLTHRVAERQPQHNTSVH